MQNPIANVFTWPADDPQLLGGQCKGCGAITFPVQSRCPRCGTQSMAELPLPRRGTLVSWTTQEFPPSVDYRGDPTGQSFEPFGMGLVQLDDVVRVESRLTDVRSPRARLRHGGRAPNRPVLCRQRRQRDHDFRLRARRRAEQ